MLSALLGTGGVGLSSSLGNVTGGSPSAPHLNTPGQIDPSSIERAYAALGLTYQGNQAPPQSVQQTQRAMNTMGNDKQRLQILFEQYFPVFFVLVHCHLEVWVLLFKGVI